MTDALIENVFLEDLDLSFNKMCRNDRNNEEILKNLSVFIEHDKNLRHLSLQGMHMSMAIENKSDDTLRDLDPKKNNMMTLFINNLKNKIDEQAP